MNKCLVTTLKAHTNNEALIKYNVLTIKTKAVESPTVNSQYIIIGASKNGSVSINSSSVGLYKKGISGELLPYPYIVTSGTSIVSHFENKDGIIEVTGKYDIISITVGSSGILRMKEFYGIPGTIKSISIRNVEEREIDATKLVNIMNRGELSELYLPIFKVAIVNKVSKDIIGEFNALKIINENVAIFDGLGLDDLSNNINITSISFFQIKGGNLSSLAKLTKLNTLIFRPYVQNNGDIMDFITPWIQASRTSGKFNVVGLLGQKNITLNGQPITYPSGVNDSNAYLNWTSDGTVTFTAR